MLFLLKFNFMCMNEHFIYRTNNVFIIEVFTSSAINLQEVEHYVKFRNLDPKLKDVILAQYRHLWTQLKSTRCEKVGIIFRFV